MVTVNERNSIPVLATQTNRTLDELMTLVVDNRASDLDLPAQTLSYSLLVAPSNATISANGVITWTPTEAQGPGTLVFTTRAEDNGVPRLNITNTFSVVVNESNSPPVLPPQVDRTITVLNTLFGHEYCL